MVMAMTGLKHVSRAYADYLYICWGSQSIPGFCIWAARDQRGPISPHEGSDMYRYLHFILSWKPKRGLTGLPSQPIGENNTFRLSIRPGGSANGMASGAVEIGVICFPVCP